jgi:hypothetical protein
VNLTHQRSVRGIVVGWNRCIINIDIRGYLVQTQMPVDSVYIRINPKVTKEIVQLFPSYSRLVDNRDCMYKLTKKAMYGCI